MAGGDEEEPKEKFPEAMKVMKREQGEWFPVGGGGRTEKGGGLPCSVWPGQKLSGAFFLGEKRDSKLPPDAWAADDDDTQCSSTPDPKKAA